MSKGNGFKQLVGRTITKVKVVGPSVLLKTEDDAFYITVDAASGSLTCTRTIKDPVLYQIPERTSRLRAKKNADQPFPFPPEKDPTLD